MLLTPYSFAFSITWGSIILLILFLSYKKLLKISAYRTIFISIIMIVIRLLFFVDLPINIRNEWSIIPICITRFIKQTLEIFPISYEIKYNIYDFFKIYRINTIFIFIWLTGFVIFIITDIYKWYGIREIYCLNEIIGSQHHNICIFMIGKIEKEFSTKIALRIHCSNYIGVPFVIGLRKPCIYINPYNFSDEQLYLILKHEIVHVLNKDNWIKMSIRIFVQFYWWFPLLWVLPSIIDDVCEYRCDKIVTKYMEPLVKFEYAGLINKISSNGSIFRSNRHRLFSAFVFIKHKDKICNRIHAIVKPQKISMYFAIPFYSLYLIVLILSLLFSFPTVLQSNYSPPLPKEISASLSNSYLVLNTDGTYALYTYDMLIDSNVKNVDELNLPIKKEEDIDYEE